MERLTRIDNVGWYVGPIERHRGEEIDLLALYENTGMIPEGIDFLIKRWKEAAEYADMCKQYGKHLRELLQAESEGRLIVLSFKPDETSQIVHCKDCKHIYFIDFEAFCPHRVGPCRPSGFCERGEKEDETK